MNSQVPDKLAILRANDHFRDWNSLDDKRMCLLCGHVFSGHEVVIMSSGSEAEVRCPTRDCHSHIQQWVHPGNPLVSEETYADWWRALAEPTQTNAL